MTGFAVPLSGRSDLSARNWREFRRIETSRYQSTGGQACRTRFARCGVAPRRAALRFPRFISQLTFIDSPLALMQTGRFHRAHRLWRRGRRSARAQRVRVHMCVRARARASTPTRTRPSERFNIPTVAARLPWFRSSSPSKNDAVAHEAAEYSTRSRARRTGGRITTLAYTVAGRCTTSSAP